MSNIIRVLTELSVFSYDDKVHNSELGFIRQIIGMVNDSNPENKYKIVRSENPITITFGNEDKSMTVHNIIGLKVTGYDTTENKKADFILITQEKRSVPISIKQTKSSTYSKSRGFGGKFKQWLLDKGEDLSTPRVYKISKEMQQDSLFGSDILPNGFVFKGDHNNYEKIGSHEYKIDGRVINNLSDLYSDEIPVLVIGSRPPEIVTRKNPGSNKKEYNIDKEFINSL